MPPGAPGPAAGALAWPHAASSKIKPSAVLARRRWCDGERLGLGRAMGLRLGNMVGFLENMNAQDRSKAKQNNCLDFFRIIHTIMNVSL
jgi:hypothetical protein